MELPEGYVEYKRREYCKAVECPVQKELESTKEGTDAYEEIRYRCKTACIHTTHEFHSWLNSQGYLIIKSK